MPDSEVGEQPAALLAHAAGHGRTALPDVSAQPWVELLEAEDAGPEQPVDEGKRLQRLGGDSQAVDGEKDVSSSKAHALVAVHEGMVLRQTFPKRRCLSEQVGLVVTSVPRVPI